MSETHEDLCGKCGAEIDSTRRVDFTLKDGTRVCDACFVEETPRVSQSKNVGELRPGCCSESFTMWWPLRCHVMRVTAALVRLSACFDFREGVQRCKRMSATSWKY